MLFKDENTGAIDLAVDPSDGPKRTILAALWQMRRPPWNVYPPSNGPGSGLYRSEDGGDTWKPVTASSAFPSEKLGRIRIAFAPSDPRRVYAIADAKEGGLYVSEDKGVSWKRASSDRRIWDRGWYFAGVTVDPQNADVVYALPHRALPLDRRRQDLPAVPGRSGRRRLPPSLDRSGRLAPHDRRERPGRGRHR